MCVGQSSGFKQWKEEKVLFVLFDLPTKFIQRVCRFFDGGSSSLLLLLYKHQNSPQMSSQYTMNATLAPEGPKAAIFLKPHVMNKRHSWVIIVKKQKIEGVSN